jgi:GNAT superfamily N-acetyltransferase
MDTVTITVHGGKECRNCKWLLAGAILAEDWYTDVYADRAIVAIDGNGHVAGVWKYDRPYYKTISSCGTCVAPKYRRRGLGKRLWEVGLAYEQPIRVQVRAVSDRGYTLVRSLEEAFPHIKWTIIECAERELRKLKKIEVRQRVASRNG